MLKEQGSEARGREIKSRRERELEELRSRGVAKTRREKLKFCKSKSLQQIYLFQNVLINFQNLTKDGIASTLIQIRGHYKLH